MLQRYRVSAAARAALSSCSLFTPFLRVVSPAPQVSIGAGPGRALAWGCDLTYDYVKINADYTCALYPSRVSAPFTETPRPHFGGQPCWAVNQEVCMGMTRLNLLRFAGLDVMRRIGGRRSH